jgi:hypothetical protein
MLRLGLPIALLALSSASVAQDVIVTAEGHHGAPPSPVNLKGLRIAVAEHPALAEGWTALRYAGLELYVVVDDGLDSRVGLQFNSLKAFITEQPPTTHVGLVYLRNGTAVIASPLSATPEQTAAALRLPWAKKDSSPVLTSASPTLLRSGPNAPPAAKC